MRITDKLMLCLCVFLVSTGCIMVNSTMVNTLFSPKDNKSQQIENYTQSTPNIEIHIEPNEQSEPEEPVEEFGV